MMPPSSRHAFMRDAFAATQRLLCQRDEQANADVLRRADTFRRRGAKMPARAPARYFFFKARAIIAAIRCRAF